MNILDVTEDHIFATLGKGKKNPAPVKRAEIKPEKFDFASVREW